MPYFVDETRIEQAQDATIAASEELRDHVAIVEAGLRFIDDFIVAHNPRNDGELIIFRLAIRCFNGAAGSFRLLRGGYYQPAFALIRDVVETLFLLDLFSRDPTALEQWHKLPAKDRENQFRPVKVRERLDQLDGYKEKKRGEVYKRLSAYASHPTPEGFVIISPNMMTLRGPFPDAKALTAGIQELAMRFGNAAIVISANIESDAETVLKIKAQFLNSLDAWLAKYMKAKTDVGISEKKMS